VLELEYEVELRGVVGGVKVLGALVDELVTFKVLVTGVRVTVEVTCCPTPPACPSCSWPCASASLRASPTSCSLRLPAP